MNEVRQRSRRAATSRAWERQGMLVMPGLESETETEAERTDQTFETVRSVPPIPTRVARARTEPRPLPYRSVLASWPDEWRERWGRRANDLEEAGLSWRDAEGRAFLEVWNQWRITADVVERN